MTLHALNLQTPISDALTVAVQQLPHGEGLALPAYATAQSAGLDLLAAIAEDVVLAPHAHALIPTGLSIALPAGYEAQVRPRSGLAAKNGVTVLNSPGTIDADYRGEIQVILMNHSALPFTITRGMRIAQMILAPVVQLQWQPVASLESSARGSGGFGSTGL
jgi:dUTP pyrophosphatase